MRPTSNIFLARASALILFAVVFFVSSGNAQDNAIHVVHNNTDISIISNQATGATTNVGTLFLRDFRRRLRPSHRQSLLS